MSGGRKVDTQRTVIARALAVLDSFSIEQPSPRLMDISRHAALPVSTVLRILSQLCEFGAVERTDDLRYRIGPALARLADVRRVVCDAVPSAPGLRHIAIPGGPPLQPVRVLGP